MLARDEFWRVMEAYGTQIRPAQVLFYIAAILVVGWLTLKPGNTQNHFAKLYLSLAFAWNGIAFYFVLASDLAGESRGNYVFGSVFIVVSLLFAVDMFRQKMQFSLTTIAWRKYATVALMFFVFCYPLFGLALGHNVSSLIMPGTFPCPTVALALLLLTMALPQVDKWIYILLLICAIPFTPFVQIARYGVYEDVVLLTTGIFALFLLLRSWKSENQLAPLRDG
jgi:hypothetical protein